MQVRVVAFAAARELIGSSLNLALSPDARVRDDAWRALASGRIQHSRHTRPRRASRATDVWLSTTCTPRRRRDRALAARRRRISGVSRIVREPIDPRALSESIGTERTAAS